METTITYLGERIKEDKYHILIFAQNAESTELKKQLDILEETENSAEKDKFDINIIYSNRQSRNTYMRYNVPFNSFAVLVMNKDKAINYRKDKTISSTELYNLLHQ